MVTFEQIMQKVEESDTGTIVRHCIPASVAEAKAAAENHPNLKVEIHKDGRNTSIVAIRPKSWKSKDAILPIFIKGSKAVHDFFKKGKK